MDTALDIVNRFYEATDRHDADSLAAMIADDMIFVGPLMTTDTASAYVGLNRDLLPRHVGTRMQHQFRDGDQVCSVYEMDVTTPADGILTLQIADLLTVRDGTISSQRLYYDPRAFAEAFGL